MTENVVFSKGIRVTIAQAVMVYGLTSILVVLAVGFNTIGRTWLQQRWQLWLGNGLLILAIVAFYSMVSFPQDELLSDFFTGYYRAGHLSREDPNNLYNTDVYHNIFGYVNIPIVSLVFIPFSFFEDSIAAIIYVVLTVLSLFCIIYFLVHMFEGCEKKIIYISIIVCMNGPLYHSVKYGNISHFVLLIVVLIFLCLRKNPLLVGCLLAIASLGKLNLLVFGVYFFLRKQWKVVQAFCAVFVLCGAMSLVIFGLDVHLVWRAHLERFVGKVITAHNVQSVDAFLGRLLMQTTGDLENWVPVPAGAGFHLLRYAFLAVLIGISGLVLWRAGAPTTLAEERLELSIVLGLSVVLSPISWAHYYALFIIPFCLYMMHTLLIPRGVAWSVGMWVSMVLLSLPVLAVRATSGVGILLYTRLVSSHYFLGGLLFLGLLLGARWHSRTSLQRKG